MRTYNVHEAKTHLSRLLARVEAGEEIVIARSGVPIARVSPLRPPVPARRVLGQGAGTVAFSADYDQADVEIAAEFDGP